MEAASWEAEMYWCTNAKYLGSIRGVEPIRWLRIHSVVVQHVSGDPSNPKKLFSWEMLFPCSRNSYSPFILRWVELTHHTLFFFLVMSVLMTHTTSVGGCVLCCIKVFFIFIPGHCCWAWCDKHGGLKGCGVRRRVISFKQEVVAR